MPSRRDQIRMTDDELRDFLAEQKTMQCATTGPGGRPHMVPLWFSPDDGELRGWTFAKSQKARNLERDPRATLGIEGGVAYEELRGVMFECDVELEHDTGRVAAYGIELFERYGGGGELGAEAQQAVEAQAAKRVGLRFTPTKTVTWDHRKLGGVY
jgi:PPOX class probable F420-dependent enzyme